MKKFAGILIMTVFFSGYASAKCDRDEQTIFSCLTGKSKLIEVCDAGKTVSYSFGFPNSKPEIVVTVPRNKASTYQWEGIGRYITYSVNIPNGNTDYNVFWSVDKLSDEHAVEAGVNVEINQELVATVKCVGEKSIVQNIEGIELQRTE
ncbi:hypothetical protein CBP31_00950 [Oceanisphaera profunda]|uniref:Uncharacterized protein n=1 Tax=Oceanisphaera profunda TaxID=1416627 RepID=A0A1Y0D2E4_9GAMM|nr:hypothetical protein [Oceanisphaera profunda]ART81376.1 hypothetical protein CBP31_00950 [Oceanisphaera profunda]